MLEIIKSSYSGYAQYLWNLITLNNDDGFWHNYFWLLIIVSAFLFSLEQLKPWRKDQATFRKDFWLDIFYMFFNFFIFSLIIFQAASNIIVHGVNNLIYSILNIDLQSINPMINWPIWAILITGFVVRDFTQWWIHRLLHAVPRLWEFHKVHHSVEQMGFAAHLRYHWMETIVYRSLEYIPLALMGIGLHDFFLIHIFTLLWGHYNHANFILSRKTLAGFVMLLLAILISDYYFSNTALVVAIAIVAFGIGYFIIQKYILKIFNSPQMHIWHHVKTLPKGYDLGINFGLTLSIWDYIFGTAQIPHDGKNITLGFDNISEFPKKFISQNTYGFTKKQN